jgi:hypothetical protein
VLFADAASSRAIFTRCASPPESVVAGWPEPQVAEPHLLQLPQRLAELLLAREEADRLVDRQAEHVVHGPAAHRHLEHVGLEAPASAGVARHVHVGHEHHLDLDVAGALARLAAPALAVEAEGARV